MTPPPDPSNLANSPTEETEIADKSNNTIKPLPTPRTLLTTLFNAISTIPLAPPPLPSSSSLSQPPSAVAATTTGEEPGRQSGENPLRRVPPSHRHLITTLHVLFPGLVLPALDLLERGLVAGVVLVPPHDMRREHEGPGHDNTTTNTDNGGGGGGDGGDDGCEEAGLGTREVPNVGQGVDTGRPCKARGGGGRRRKGRYAFFMVQSAAAAEARERIRRRKRSGGGEDGGETGMAGKVSIVRLDAWHCSCAAFAFASVQGDSVGSLGYRSMERDSGMVAHDDKHGTASLAGDEDQAERGAEGTWSFGGLSLDGTRAGASEGVPVCKHLLACVLADRWHAALGSYVVEKTMQREEMAGILAEI
ncbi:hypothetical protein VTH82DRAFT_127 [Thermothelomyces myriococcoides]